MNMNTYLIQEAEAICRRPLPEIGSLQALTMWKEDRLRKFQEANGILHYLEQKRTPLHVRVTGVYERDGYTLETLYYESLPGLYVAGNLYLPDVPSEAEPSPAIVYLNGHTPKQKIFYQSHAQQLVKLGLAVFIIDTIQWGENIGYHHGTYSLGWFHWISKGYTPVGVEVWNAIRAVDLLCERPEIDSEQIGVTGNSGGGSITWWHACCDSRVKVLAPSCGTGELDSHLRDNTVDDHCDCFFPNNPYGWSMTEMYAMVAPRPLLIAASVQDLYFTAESIRAVYDRLKRFYTGFGAGELVQLAEFDGPHGYNTANRMAIAAWILKHLAGRELTDSDKEVFERSWPEETMETLSAFKEGIPANDESSTVQDWFIPAPDLSLIHTKEELAQQRERLIERLSAETFAFFPDHLAQPRTPELTTVEHSTIEHPTPEHSTSEYQINHRWQGGGNWHFHFDYRSEQSWRLQGALSGKLETYGNTSMPTVVYLRGSASGSGQDGQRMLGDLSSSWLKARLDTRGSGNTAWAPSSSTHLRRSAMILGRTLPAMMIQDALKGIEALRAMPEVDPRRIVLAAKGEMAVVALYAALLDRSIFALVLENPVGTLNKPDEGVSEGDSMPIELINAWRYTDLPNTAALLYPMPIIFVQKRPESYRWTEQQYHLLGDPGGTWRVSNPAVLLEQIRRIGTVQSYFS